MDKYGVFANVVGIASALIAAFSILLLKMIGRTRNWTWMAADQTSAIMTVGSRLLALGLMAMTYITINTSNYTWFGVGAVLCGVLGLYYLIRFDHMRKIYVVQVPLVGADGQQRKDKKRKLVFKNVVIGLESNMNPEAKEAFIEARKNIPGLSLVKFMSGYGTPNDPESIWDRSLLANLSNKLTMALIFIALFGVMVLFLASFTIEVFTHKS
jgi:hypothetical protein